MSAVLTEWLLCAVTAGFYGSFVQLVRNARPEWVTGLLITVLMPALFQGLEYGMHWPRGTPHLRAAEIASVVASALSALFNWYAMRRGALLVGGEGGKFSGDLTHIARLVAGFLISLPRWLLQWLRVASSSLPIPSNDRAGEQIVPLKTMHVTNSWHGTSGGIATLLPRLNGRSQSAGQAIGLVVPGALDGVEDGSKRSLSLRLGHEKIREDAVNSYILPNPQPEDRDNATRPG